MRLVLLFCCLAACTSSNDVCNGDDCVCAAGEACQHTCSPNDGTGCHVQCAPGETCDVTCAPGEDCNVEASATAHATVDCGGSIDCEVTCPPGGCTVSHCTSPTCTVACPTGPAAITGTTASCP